MKAEEFVEKVSELVTIVDKKLFFSEAVYSRFMSALTLIAKVNILNYNTEIENLIYNYELKYINRILNFSFYDTLEIEDDYTVFAFGDLWLCYDNETDLISYIDEVGDKTCDIALNSEIFFDCLYEIIKLKAENKKYEEEFLKRMCTMSQVSDSEIFFRNIFNLYDENEQTDL